MRSFQWLQTLDDSWLCYFIIAHFVCILSSSHSDEKVEELLANLISFSDNNPKPPLQQKRSLSPPGVHN